MKIGSTPTPATDAVARPAPQAGPAAGVAAPARTRATDSVDLSPAGAQIGALDSSADFDSAKVDAIRQAIRDGKFSVNAGAIADRLIADAASLLGPRPPTA